MSKPRILLVDDDSSLLRLLNIRLAKAGYEVDAVENSEQALGHLPSFRPNLVITDLQMEGMDGMGLFSVLQKTNPSLPVIILTAHGTIPDAVEATQRGIFTYLTKPFDSRVLLGSVAKALQLSSQPLGSRGSLQEPLWRREIVSRSATMQGLLAEAERVASSDVSVFIQSETGTGKELLAQAIHKASNRKDKPFIPVNCSAIPEQLLESELFGHKKGSFTGAHVNHEGLFRAAHGGTLFLDEIGETPIGFQAKLLRVLQEKEIRPVGGTSTVPVDVRIISATNKNLEIEVEAGRFRDDLYYRLNVVMLELPPLSRRREDIPLLTNKFLTEVCGRIGRGKRKFPPEAMEMLVSAPWPGNVRQLLNVVEQCAVLSATQIIPANLVQRSLRGKTGGILPLAEAQKQNERDYLVQVLEMTEGNVTRAARIAKRNRTEFYKLLNRHHFKPEMFRIEKQ